MGRASGLRFEQLTNDMMARYYEMTEMFERELLADGFPPGSQPSTPREQYEELKARMLADDPQYWNDPEAIQALARLSTRYGPPSGPPEAYASPNYPSFLPPGQVEPNAPPSLIASSYLSKGALPPGQHQPSLLDLVMQAREGQ